MPFATPASITETFTTGTVSFGLDGVLAATTIDIAGTASAAVLTMAGDAGISAATPSIAANSEVSSLVPGQTGAGSTVLDASGDFVNQGIILANGPAGSKFTLNIQQSGSGSAAVPGYFINYGTILATAGNTLTVNVGTNAALFNPGTIIANGGSVFINAASGIDGGYAPVLGIAAIANGGTLETNATYPASISGTYPTYLFLDGHAGDTLKLDHAAQLTARINNFQAGDTIDLGGSFAVSQVVYNAASSVLALENSGGTILASFVVGGATSGTWTVNATTGAAGSYVVSKGADGDTLLTVTTANAGWNNTSGSWQTAADWSGGSIPTAGTGADIGFGSTGTFTVTTGTAAVVADALNLDDPNALLRITSTTSIAPSAINILGGTIEIAAGKTLSGLNLRLYSPSAVLTIDPSAALDLTGRLNTGFENSGTIAIVNGNSGAAQVNGLLLVNGGTLNAGPGSGQDGGSFTIGYDGASGTVTAEAGGSVTDTYSLLGSDATSAGTLTLAGPGTQWSDEIDPSDSLNSRGYIIVGYNNLAADTPAADAQPPLAGTARLSVENGATLTDARAYIGDTADSSGSVTVSSGGTWNIGLAAGGYLGVSSGGAASLSILSGGTVNVGHLGTFLSNGIIYAAGGVSVGESAGEAGTITVSGVLNDHGAMTLGEASAGILEIVNGGTVLSGPLTAGVLAGSSGTILVSGTDSCLMTNGSLVLGGSTSSRNGTATGTLSATSGGYVGAFGDLYIWAGSTVSVDSTSSMDFGWGVSNVAGAVSIDGFDLIGDGLVAAAINNSGIIEATNNSVLSASTGGNLEITGGVTGTGTIIIASGATLQIDGSLASTQAIGFASGGAPETLILGSPSATISNAISGLTGGDRIEFANGATVTAASVVNGKTLAVSYHIGNGAAAVYDFTDVTFAAPAPATRISYDYVTNDDYVVLTTYLVWTGGSSTSFSSPANWSGGTIVPTTADFALFNDGAGGTISGTDTVEGLNFANSGTWSLASGTALNSVSGLYIGGSGGGTNAAGAMTVGSGSSVITGSGQIMVGANAGNAVSLTISGGGVLQQTAADSQLNYIMYIGTGGSSGTLAAASASVVVTGTGSVLDLPFNGIEIGNSGASGNVTVSNGGSILASTQNSNDAVAIAVGRTGNGSLTVTGAGSQVTAVGEIYVGRSETGTLTVENDGAVVLEPDATGIDGIVIGSGNTVGVGGTGVATVTTGGDLISTSYVEVGVRGTAGELTVNGGTVQVGTTLAVGSGGTIQNGASYAGNGTLTIGAGGTVELTGGPQTASYGVILASSNNSQLTASDAVVSVSGAGALLNTDGNGIGVGQYGTALLTVSQGGSVAAGTANSGSVAALGIGRQGSGTVTVSGAGSRLTAAGSVFVGRAGSGTLTIQNQGTVLIGVDANNAGGITIGGGGFSSGNTLFTGGSGTASVTTGGYLFSSQDVTVGRNGTSGSLSVTGGTVEAGTDFFIGSSATLAAGAYDVVGNTITQAATAEVFNGVGTVTVGTGGLIKVDATGLATGAPGLTIGSAAGGADTLSVTSGGSVFAGGGLSIFEGSTVSVATGGGIDVGGAGVTNAGVISGNGLLQAAAVNNIGTVLAAAGGKLEITGSLAAIGSVAGSGSLDIASGATLQLDGSLGTSQTIFFGGPGATLTLGKPASPANPLVGLGAGDRIDLSGVTLTAAAISGNTLTLKQGTTSYVFTSSASLANDRVQLLPDGGTGTTATLYAEAAATVTPKPVTFANVHVGANAVQTLAVANTTAASPYAEALDAALSGASAGFTSAGTITGLATGASNAKALTITESTAKPGALTGSVSVALVSDGTGIDGLGTVALASQTVNLSGAVYALAAPILSNGTVSLGAARVGGTLAAGSIRLSDGTLASAYQESLIYVASGATVTNGSGTIASGGSATVGFGLSTATAGTIAGTASLALTSTGVGTSLLANTALAAQSVTLSGTVFAAAEAALGATTINFGIVHIGAAATQTVGITNTATGALVDVLTAGTVTSTGRVTSEVYSLGTGLASGIGGSVTIRVNTAVAGAISGSAVLGFSSHDADLADIAINGGTITVSGTIDNYATAQIVQSGGVGTLTHSGTAYTFNFGSVAQGTAVLAALGVQNTAGGPADTLSGSFTGSGTTSFTNSGFTAFSGLVAGAEETSQSVMLNTGTAGVFSETITLLGTGSNTSGYAGTLAPEVLTITGTVVAGQTYTLTTAAVTIVGGAGNDTFKAAANTLVSGDSLDGGAGNNTLELLGGGTFDLRAPAKLANIQLVTAQESAAGTTVYMRSALNVIVNVASAGGGSLVIHGNTDSDAYALGTGSDTVVLGSATEIVDGGGGTALVQATAAFAGAAVVGTTSGTTTLEITSGGTVNLSAADTDLTVKLDAKTNLSLDSLGFITAVGSSGGGDTLTAGGANQTLQSVGGNEMLAGSTSYGDTFLGTAAGFASDVIKNFGGSDVIDFTDIAYTALKPLSFTTATDKLMVSDATHSASVTFTGSYTAANFTTAADGHGGTLIKWV